MNNVHGVAVDPETNRVFVNDRGNRRIQVFRRERRVLVRVEHRGPAGQHSHVSSSRPIGTSGLRIAGRTRSSNTIWTANFLYSWGTYGEFPGGIAGVHGMSVDQEANLYLAQVDNKGGVQKFVPRAGADPDYVIGKPLYAAWE